uniref:Ribonuc_red_lgN domain-containing protein n=1 Tax=Steinernema glaseri TaxID=37863 RepID=A0A1I7YR37_9BILA
MNLINITPPKALSASPILGEDGRPCLTTSRGKYVFNSLGARGTPGDNWKDVSTTLEAFVEAFKERGKESNKLADK